MISILSDSSGSCKRVMRRHWLQAKVCGTRWTGGGDGLGKGAVIIARTRECESFLLANLQVFAVIYFLTHPFFGPVNRASGYKLVCKTPYVRTVIRFGYLSGTLLVTSSFFFFVFFFSDIDNDFVTCVAQSVVKLPTQARCRHPHFAKC